MAGGRVGIDGDVDFVDYAVFASQWMERDCAEQNWCVRNDIYFTSTTELSPPNGFNSVASL